VWRFFLYRDCVDEIIWDAVITRRNIALVDALMGFNVLLFLNTSEV